MTSEQAKLLQRALAPCLKAAGFGKQGATWRRQTPATIAMLNLQGSQWGPQFYVNLGVYLRELGDEEQPPERRCHVRLRAGALVPEPRRFHELVDFQQPIEVEQRVAELAHQVGAVVVPWLVSMGDRVLVAKWVRQHPDGVLLTAAARAALT